MRLKINERDMEFGTELTLQQLRQQVKPDADLLIVNGFPATAETVLADGDRVILIRRGEAPDAAELEALLTARHTPGVHEKVRNATVGVAGVGGLGSAVAIALARIGIGRLVLADFDVVEPSNLNRQQYFIDQIGLPKVYALRDTLARINPHVRVTACNVKLTPGNIPDIFEQAGILVEAFDNPGQKAMLVETFRRHYPQRPIVAGSGMAGYGPANTVLTRQMARGLYLCGDGTTAAGPGVGLMAPRVGVAAHHQANAVMRLILAEDPVGEEQP